MSKLQFIMHLYWVPRALILLVNWGNMDWDDHGISMQSHAQFEHTCCCCTAHCTPITSKSSTTLISTILDFLCQERQCRFRNIGSISLWEGIVLALPLALDVSQYHVAKFGTKGINLLASFTYGSHWWQHYNAWFPVSQYNHDLQMKSPIYQWFLPRFLWMTIVPHDNAL